MPGATVAKHAIQKLADEKAARLLKKAEESKKAEKKVIEQPIIR